jgi:hypothetical protein
MPENKLTHGDLFSGILAEDLQLLLPGLESEPFSSLRSSPTVAESCPSDGPISLTSVTFDTPQTLSLFADESQFSQPESPASRLPLPGSEKAHEMTVGSGRQLSMLLDSSGPLGAFSKILLESSAWTNSEEYCYVWQILDTPFGCSAFQLTQLAPGISGTESLLWPTPLTSEPKCTGKPDSLLKTAKLWPTPRASDANSPGIHGNGGQDLRTVVGREGSGSLNPRFVCELMGFEADHTNLKHWETLSCRNKRSRSSKRSTKSKQH